MANTMPTGVVRPELVELRADTSGTRYMKRFSFRDAAGLLGSEMKDTHTVIEKWPYRLRLRPGQPGAPEGA